MPHNVLELQGANVNMDLIRDEQSLSFHLETVEAKEKRLLFSVSHPKKTLKVPVFSIFLKRYVRALKFIHTISLLFSTTKNFFHCEEGGYF